MSVFDRTNLSTLKKDVLSGKVDADTLLPDLVDWVSCDYYNLFYNKETGEHRASPASRRGNAAYALRQSYKKSDLSKLLKKSTISYETPSGIYSHLLFFTMTIDHKEMSRDEANYFVTAKGKGISRFFARFEKCIKGGYSKVIVKESTTSGYPAVHVILHLDTPLKVRWHRKSGTHRPDPTDPYTRSVLGKLKNLDDWNSRSPLWRVGFVDVYAFTRDCMGMKGYTNPINYIAKYISKSLDLEGIPDLDKCKRVSDLPMKFRTRVWTILNSLIWNSQTWILSKSFKEDLKKIKEQKPPPTLGMGGHGPHLGSFPLQLDGMGHPLSPSGNHPLSPGSRMISHRMHPHLGCQASYRPALVVRPHTGFYQKPWCTVE